jgi:hypothetical protein
LKSIEDVKNVLPVVVGMKMTPSAGVAGVGHVGHITGAGQVGHVGHPKIRKNVLPTASLPVHAKTNGEIKLSILKS